MRRSKTQRFRRRLLGVFLCLCMIMSAVGSVDPATAFAAAPENTETPELTEVPVPEESTEVPETPDPEASPEVSETPAPEASPEVSETPDPEASPEVSEDLDPEASPEVPEEPEPTEDPDPSEAPAGQNYACLVEEDGLEVSAIADPDSGIPADAELHAVKVEQGTEAYAQAFAAVREKLGLGEEDELYFLPYDVYFTAPEAEGRIEPQAGLVSVTMRFEADPFAALLTGEGAEEPADPADPDGDSPEEAAPGEEGQDQVAPGAGDPAQDSPVLDGPGLEEPGLEEPGAGAPEESAPAPEMVTERFVVHIRADGSVEKLEPETAEDGAITFAVASFSVMGPVLVRRMAAPTAPGPVVPQENIYVPAAPADAVDTAEAGSIQAALEQLADGGTIWLTGNQAIDTVTLNGLNVTVKSFGEAGPYTVTKSGAGANMFVLTGGASLTLEHVAVDAANNTAGRTVSVSGGSTLTLGAGAALVNNISYGAVFLDNSTIKIEGGAIRDNSTTKDEATLTQNTYGTAFRFAYNSANAGNQGLGGAVLMANNSTFDMTAGEISGNSAICGGGVYAYDSIVSISGGTFSGNTADTVTANQAYGGALHVDGAASTAVTIGGSAQFSGNSAQRGGAFSIGIDADTVALTITGGTFSGNSVSGIGSIAFIGAMNSVIDISGATFSNNSAAAEGGIYKWASSVKSSNGTGKFTIHGNAQFIENTAKKGPCVYATKDNAGSVNEFLVDGVTFRGNTATDNAGVMQYNVPNSTFKVINSTFENNRSDNNGGCFYAAVDAKGTTFTFEKSTFTGNYAKNQGGVWRGFPPQSEFVFTGCTFTNNTAELGDGGCFYFPGDGTSSNITIDGGTFTGNKSGSSGGAFRANLNGGTVTVTGGAVFRGNSADVNAGAFSIRRKGAGYYGEAYLRSCTVDGNWCNANFDNYKESDLEPTKHYNTGGVYIGENITCYMYDALVTGNSVLGGYVGTTVGNGIGLCPNAQVFLYPEHGATICNNGDNGGMDIVAVPYDETIHHETPAKLYVSSTTPDGRAYNWTDLTGGEARTGGYDWTNVRSGIATISALDDGYHSETTLTPVGFKAHVADAGIMTTDASSGGYSVYITNNFTKSALYAGGGMMVNGRVIAGEFNVNVEKKVVVEGSPSTGKETEINNTEFKFRFSIIDTESTSTASNLHAPESEVAYTLGTGKTGTLKFNEGTTTYGETDRKYIYCDFSVTGQDTVNIGTIKKEDIGIGHDKHDYRFLLEETDTGGAHNVTITPEYSEYGSSSGYETVTNFKFTVTNTFSFGKLMVSKTVVGPGADEEKLWTFNIELKNGDVDLEGDYYYEIKTDGVADPTETGQVTVDVSGNVKIKEPADEGDGSIQLKHNQSITIHDLPAGTTYTVKETEANTGGYDTQVNGADYDVANGATGEITTGTTQEAKFTNIKKTATLPDTGGPGFMGLALFSTLLCLAGGGILLSATGRRGKHSRRARIDHHNAY